MKMTLPRWIFLRIAPICGPQETKQTALQEKNTKKKEPKIKILLNSSVIFTSNTRFVTI